MAVVLGVGVGFLAARMVWLLLRPTLAAPVLVRRNHRGYPVPTGAGLVLAGAVLAVEGGRALAGAAASPARGLTGGRLGMLVLVAGLALVGLVDDLLGDGAARGFRGHLAALVRGRLTTGGLKLVGGAAVAVVAVAAARPGTHPGLMLCDAALVALCANLGNLFDRAPGRTIKVAALAFAVLAAATGADSRLVAAAVVVGAALALLGADLGERVMLGDTGANVVGGAVGLAVVATCGPVPRLAVLAGVAILNGLSEQVSFSGVIDRVAPLRALDRAGRRRHP